MAWLDGIQALGVGDILRLPENYDLGPGSPPVDLMLCNLSSGLGLVVVSGYKSGLILAVLPEAARTNGGISTSWLADNWTKWFRFTYVDVAVPMEGARILRQEERNIVEAS